MKAFTSGCSSTVLTDDERAFFAEHDPWGLIVFARNVESVEQLRSLCDDFRRAVDDPDRPILIDQEGGRVQRMRPPVAPDYPSNAELAANYARDPKAVRRSVYILSRLHAFDLSRVGIDVDCLPVLDLPSPDADPVIGNRAFGSDPELVADLGRAACDGLLDGGVLPVIKHVPGHGRADADSHKALPRVSASLADLRARDFVPFRALRAVPLAMSAHVVFEAIDGERPATLSRAVVEGIVREEIGFGGLLLSDDISMNALTGTFADRTRGLLEAGCDIALHCNGVMDEMVEVAEASPVLEGAGRNRSEAALAMRGNGDGADERELRREFETLTGVDVTEYAA